MNPPIPLKLLHQSAAFWKLSEYSDIRTLIHHFANVGKYIDSVDVLKNLFDNSDVPITFVL